MAVPPTLEATTTYVLLEQEDWFEKELAFVRRYVRPGMTAIDVGANLGVYSIPMAKGVGPNGAVYSYEPIGETRSFLSRSMQLNQCTNLHVSAAAVADHGGEANKPASSAGGRTELTSLDLQDAAVGWRSPDFIRIGADERILQGGLQFFARHSPLVMFSIRPGLAVHPTIRQMFQPMGYSLYRLLVGEPILVPHGPSEAVDEYEVNLFAAKPDRVAQLASAGLLAERIPTWTPDAQSRARAMSAIAGQRFGAQFAARFGDAAPADPAYLDCLAAYATWRSPETALAERCAALNFAVAELDKICLAGATLPRLSTLARAAWDAGQRATCVHALVGFINLYGKGHTKIQEPLWPASPRFDGIDPGSDIGNWFVCSAAEQLERAGRFSSYFKPSAMNLDQLCSNPFVSAEMERRRVLQIARKGSVVNVPQRLREPAADHVNAKIWRAGRVPNTNVATQ
jgi:hypothetical protein